MQNIGIFCSSGGQCDLTNSNSSFGNKGLVADGYGAVEFDGTVLTTTDAETDTVVINNTQDQGNNNRTPFDGQGAYFHLNLSQYNDTPANNTITAPLEQIRSLEITNGKLFDTVVDASGDHTGLNTAINIAKNEGQIISFSLVHPDKVEFNHRQWMTKNLQLNATVAASTSNPIQEIKEVVNLASRGWLEPGKLRSHNMKFDQMKEAFEMYRQKKDNVIKIAISF